MDRKSWVGVGMAVLLVGCAGTPLMRTEAELAQRNGEPLATTVSASVTRDAALRAGPDEEMRVLEQLPAGAEVTVSESISRGFRRVTTADGKSGFVDARALQLAAGGGSTTAPAAK